MSGYKKHVFQHPASYSLCTGCQSCDVVCSLTHDGVTGPTHGRIRIDEPNYLQLRFRILACQQCEDHPCYEACPKKDAAMCIDENGIVYINEEFCIGCGLCAKKCKFTPSRIVVDRVERKAKKCDLCRNRPEGPACVQYCPVRCLGVTEEQTEGGAEK
ncbi:MAG: 4Fe-4S dicluster domain-containing protein [Oscillibacter sp.]|nr:4Fe-4S dicluster domain-containing protein [Oscillibacter sp.]